VLDIAAAISIAYVLIIMPVWCIYDPAFHSHVAPGTKLPIQLKILLLDGIPTVLGVTWLSYRHGEALASKWPFVRTHRFRLIVMAIAVIVGTIISIKLEAK
jgi:hypothetical protein